MIVLCVALSYVVPFRKLAIIAHISGMGPQQLNQWIYTSFAQKVYCKNRPQMQMGSSEDSGSRLD